MTDELQAMLDKATAGEWKACLVENAIYTDDHETHLLDDDDAPNVPHDLAAIVAAINWCRTELPALIAERDALREALWNATALIGHRMPMAITALVAGQTLVTRDVWNAGRTALGINNAD